YTSITHDVAVGSPSVVPKETGCSITRDVAVGSPSGKYLNIFSTTFSLFVL
ncbi:unnamed protein product, partial [Rotaria magnacalcarata]